MESKSTTVHPDSVMITIELGAHERRDVAIADVKGAYLNTNIDEFLLLKLKGD